MSSIKWRYEGIGTVLSSGGLQVPKHQREYSWKKEHVEELCKDFSNNRGSSGEYFLGTVVLTSAKPGAFQVVDGQQRLATATMLLSAIRDIHITRGESELAESIQTEYLSRFDPDKEEQTSKLVLNVKDNSYFRDRVIAQPKEDARKQALPLCPSNRKIEDASKIVRTHIEKSLQSLSEKGKKDALKEWVKFLKFQARVVVIEVADSASAYTMFETLNDRGLKVSKADLVKNYVFGLSGDDRIDEAETKWTSTISALESIGEDDEVIDFLRIYCSLPYGLTRERQVFRRIKDNITSAAAAIRLVESLEIFSRDYVAMLTPEHPKWNSYPQDIRRSIRTLLLFNVTQIRPLMLAVAHHFSEQEASKAFRMFISWIVRLFIAGAGKVGRVEEEYATWAGKIHRKQLSKAAELADLMLVNLPSDKDFIIGFETAHVGKEALARYYLDAMERKQGKDSNNAELVPNEDTSEVNLEHILPEKPHNNWPHLTKEIALEYHSRLGNMALLNAKKNSALGNTSYDKKRHALRESPFKLTQLAANGSSWGPEEIEQRQKKLASIAVKTWVLKPF